MKLTIITKYMIFLSLSSATQLSIENKCEVNVSSVSPETEDYDHIIVSQKSNEVVDEELVPNNTFVSNIPKDPSIDSLDEAAVQYNMISIAQINSEDCGVPMSIFDNVRMNNSIYFFFKRE